MEIVKNAILPKYFGREIKCEICSCVFKLENGDQAKVRFLGAMSGYSNYKMNCPCCSGSIWFSYDNAEYAEYPLTALPHD